MNVLQGEIETVRVDGHFSLVYVRVGGLRLTAIVIDTPATAPYLQVGRAVQVLFKESEVIMGRGNDLSISLQNRLPGTIRSIQSGPLLSKIVLDTPVGPVTSIITTNAVQQLGLAEGQEATALIKTNEMMLAAC